MPSRHWTRFLCAIAGATGPYKGAADTPVARYRGAVLIAEVARRHNPIRDIQVQDCLLRGPAVVFNAGNNVWGGAIVVAEHVDDLILPSTDAPPPGAILLDHCTFVNCRFEGIRFTGSAKQVQEMREHFRG